MLEVKIPRIYRETLTVTEEQEVGASDITEQIRQIVKRSRISDGFVQVFSVGSTGSIISIEFEEGLMLDLKDALRRLIPRDLNYYHGRTWQDGNAHAHLRATLLGPQLMVPVSNGGPNLGTWQQIACVNLDSRTREREIIVTVFGD
ncbi:MAG: secondary thiamine-phosphate synthase enzyme YjbQ [Rhodoplanes sp.]